jgi:hypothetical protein
MIRINLADWLINYPEWYKMMFQDALTLFRNEYKVNDEAVFKYLRDESAPVSSQRLAEILEMLGANPTPYHKDGLPSWGILLREDDPVVVEYKLKVEEKTHEN